MKSKVSFVTNSSSSSFILGNKTVKEAAKNIIEAVIEDTIYLFGKKEVPDLYFEALEEVRYLKKEDTPILIPFTCNYPTFIYKKEGRIYVETCKNHDWSGLDIMKYRNYDEADDEEIEDKKRYYNVIKKKKQTKHRFYKEEEKEYTRELKLRKKGG